MDIEKSKKNPTPDNRPAPPTESISTISFFHFREVRHRWWAFKQMRLMPARLQGVEGLVFFKMLGSGGGRGFSIWPDWSSYALLGVWQSPAHYQAFLASDIYQEFDEHSYESFRLRMKAYQGKGQWNGLNPFKKQNGDPRGELMAVLTRASIRRRRLWQFWRFVPGVSRRLFEGPGLIFAKGVGEWPLLEQATFSIWNTAEAMQAFAYHKPEHRAVIKKTRALDWYREEMFVRFELLSVSGSWNGKLLDIS